jgi:hypothetical protein
VPSQGGRDRVLALLVDAHNPLNANVSGTENASTFSLTLTATSGTGLYLGVAGTIDWSGTRTMSGALTLTTAGVWTPNLNRPLL